MTAYRHGSAKRNTAFLWHKLRRKPGTTYAISRGALQEVRAGMAVLPSKLLYYGLWLARFDRDALR